MKTSESSKIQSPPRNDLDKLKRQKETLVDHELSEIEKLKAHYADKKAIVKKEKEEDLESVKDAHKKEYLEAIDQHQDQLLKKADDYKTLEKNLDEARNQLIASEKKELDNLRQSYKDNMEAQYKNALDQADEMTTHTDHIIVKARVDADRALASGQKQFGAQLEGQSMSHANQIKNKENLFKLSQNTNDIEQSKILNAERQKRQKLMDSEEIMSKNRLSSQKNLYLGQFENEKGQYQEKLNQQRENFLQRYQSLREAHDKVITDTENKLHGEYQNTTSSLVKTKEEIESKAKDPFYRPTVLSPKVSDDGTNYIVSVKIPEHEKEMVTMNANQRSLKLNMTRSYDQSVKLEDGSYNKSKRSEVFTKEFSVPEIVDARSVTQKYENGTLFFKIKKA